VSAGNVYEQSDKINLKVEEKRRKNMGTILIVILILVLVGVLPTWPHSRSWGYYPSGGLGLILLILIILLLMGRI
jgi:uncharacterized integral membrane protein